MKAKATIGGQAVIEGIMLRKKDIYTVAVRNPKKKIIVTKHRIRDRRKGIFSIFKYPILRGMYSLFEMMDIGMRTLIYSSNISIDEKDEKLSKNEVFWLISVSMLIAVGFFVVLPYVLTYLLGINEASKPVFFNFIDAVIKIVFFIIYIVAIARMKDIKRLFQYHGAEHKVVYCYEHGKQITVSNAKKYSCLHPRCGSSFIMLVITISIFMFSLIPLIVFSIFPSLSDIHPILRGIVFVCIRIVFMLPLIAGLSYELLKFTGLYSHNIISKVISWPGLMLQKLTTAEPDDKQIGVAIRAIEKLI